MPALSRLVERFVETLDLRDIILVVGDAGGPIGLGVAARHPDWFAGLVLAGTFGWPLKDYPKVKRMLGIVSSPLFLTRTIKIVKLPLRDRYELHLVVGIVPRKLRFAQSPLGAQPLA